MMSSSGTNRWAPRAWKRCRIGGTFTLAKCSPSVVGLRTTTARLSESPEMYGNGCAGSTASGVSTGKTLSSKSWPARVCSSAVSSDQRRISMPSLARDGRMSSPKQAACRAISSRVRFRMASWTSRGSPPLAARTAIPVAMRRFRPATRTM